MGMGEPLLNIDELLCLLDQLMRILILVKKDPVSTVAIQE